MEGELTESRVIVWVAILGVALELAVTGERTVAGERGRTEAEIEGENLLEI